MRAKVLRAALALGLMAAPLGAWEQLRLPWVFSDEPDLNADFSFAPLADGRTQVSLDLGGRFAGFGLAQGATRAPRLAIEGEFNPPDALEAQPVKVKTFLDLGDTLAEYGQKFERRHFDSSSTYVYKAQMSVELVPGDYNVSISIKDPELQIDSYRTLHLIVPKVGSVAWSLGDLKFITAVGKRLDAKGREQRVLDPDPWRQVGGDLHWGLMVAYNDRGARPAGKLTRHHSVQRLRGESAPVWEESGEAPAKKTDQVWLINVPLAKVKKWPAGVYVLKVELAGGGQRTEAIKTFEVLP